MSMENQFIQKVHVPPISPCFPLRGSSLARVIPLRRVARIGQVTQSPVLKEIGDPRHHRSPRKEATVQIRSITDGNALQRLGM